MHLIIPSVHPFTPSPNLNTKALESILNRRESLLTHPTSWRTENQLSIQHPVGINTPGLSNLLVDQGVVVLEVCTETLGLESGPDGELVHGVGLGCPDWEFVGVEGELLLHG